MDRGWRGWGRAALLAIILFGALTGRAVWAHVNLIAAVPEPGASLTSSPPEVQLTFDGELDHAQSRVMLFNEVFQAVPEVTILPEDGEADRLTALLPPLAPGRYTVQWAVVSTDGHPIRGSYAFALVEPSLFSRLMVPIIVVLLLVIILATVLYGMRRRVQKKTSV